LVFLVFTKPKITTTTNPSKLIPITIIATEFGSFSGAAAGKGESVGEGEA
jgi:hypothetical protein